ncbi:MAG TPA: hypothetical protein VKY19_20190 [Ktedonosporobacter sp.]|jgi:hypothetical protein|nr:hypothetical protein [Ktedonosporobacter sp.]
MDILYLVDRLENLIASSRKMPLLNQIIIKEGELFGIVDQMRTSIPDEIKQARRIIQDKERIIAQAQADAASILARAREETERVMNREGLLQAAEERSQELVQQANRQAQDMLRQAEEYSERLKVEADGYVIETLRALREHLMSIETDIGRTILSVERGLESLEQPPDEMEPADDGEGDEDQLPSDPPPAPRRASLATDTTGGPTYS